MQYDPLIRLDLAVSYSLKRADTLYPHLPLRQRVEQCTLNQQRPGSGLHEWVTVTETQESPKASSRKAGATHECGHDLQITSRIPSRRRTVPFLEKWRRVWKSSTRVLSTGQAEPQVCEPFGSPCCGVYFCSPSGLKKKVNDLSGMAVICCSDKRPASSCTTRDMLEAGADVYHTAKVYRPEGKTS